MLPKGFNHTNDYTFLELFVSQSYWHPEIIIEELVFDIQQLIALTIMLLHRLNQEHMIVEGKSVAKETIEKYRLSEFIQLANEAFAIARNLSLRF
jgi:hypothetical protein